MPGCTIRERELALSSRVTARHDGTVLARPDRHLEGRATSLVPRPSRRATSLAQRPLTADEWSDRNAPLTSKNRLSRSAGNPGGRQRSCPGCRHRLTPQEARHGARKGSLDPNNDHRGLLVRLSQSDASLGSNSSARFPSSPPGGNEPPSRAARPRRGVRCCPTTRSRWKPAAPGAGPREAPARLRWIITTLITATHTTKTPEGANATKLRFTPPNVPGRTSSTFILTRTTMSSQRTTPGTMGP